jgi:hypothetical protein
MFQVFLSSTARDLAAYREAATRAIHGIDGFHCVRMEDFGARDAMADAFCQEKVAACDVVVLLLGLCYGSSPKGSEDSYTRQEYRAAVETERPRLVFFSKEDTFYPGYYREPDELWARQQVFRREVGAERVRAEFTTPDDLATKVASALANWAREQGARVSTDPVSGTVVRVEGNGAAAVGPGAVAAGAGGVAVGGDVHGEIHIGKSR